jgi:hypothetical protein
VPSRQNASAVRRARGIPRRLLFRFGPNRHTLNYQQRGPVVRYTEVSCPEPPAIRGFLIMA